MWSAELRTAFDKLVEALRGNASGSPSGHFRNSALPTPPALRSENSSHSRFGGYRLMITRFRASAACHRCLSARHIFQRAHFRYRDLVFHPIVPLLRSFGSGPCRGVVTTEVPRLRR